jgi:PAS domain S-box-containing protein
MNALVTQTLESLGDRQTAYHAISGDCPKSGNNVVRESPLLLSSGLSLSNVAHFANALDTHLLVSIFGLDGITIYANEKFCESFKFRSSDILGKTFETVISPCNCCGYFEEIYSTIKKGEIWKGEIQSCGKDGSIYWLDAIIIPCFDKTGIPYQFISICTDITARKESEADLYRSRNELRALANHLEQVQESERKRIAREVHDELGQHLLALKLDVYSLRADSMNDNPNFARKTQLVLQGIDETMRHVKRIINDLRPIVLELGLADAIRSHVTAFAHRTGISCEIIMSDENLELSDKIVTTLFRVLQESLVNVSRHAHASRVSVTLRCQDNLISIEIADNGKGIGVDDGNRRKSFGLLGMRERIEALNGKFLIETILNGGTKVIASVPSDISVGK